MPEWLNIALIVLASCLLLFVCIYLFLIRTRRAGKAISSYRGVNFAHRGLHGEGRAENSLSAFIAARDAGFGIELDVRLSADGEMVVFHDDTLTRVTGIDKRVDELTLAELRELRLLGGDDTVPTLREVLEVIDGRVPLLIEIKEDAGKSAVTRTLVRELEGYVGPYIVESFNPLALKLFRKLRPEVPIGILAQHFCRRDEYRGKPLYFILQNMLLNFLYVPDFVAYDHTDSGMLSLKLARSLFGTVTVAWTVRSEEEGRVAKTHKFDSIIFENYLPDEGRADVSTLPKFVN